MITGQSCIGYYSRWLCCYCCCCCCCYYYCMTAYFCRHVRSNITEFSVLYMSVLSGTNTVTCKPCAAIDWTEHALLHQQTRSIHTSQHGIHRLLVGICVLGILSHCCWSPIFSTFHSLSKSPYKDFKLALVTFIRSYWSNNNATLQGN